MQQENRRVKKTKSQLNASFLKFLDQKPLSRITVREICEDADVNRSTFYFYYSDPYDQLHKIEEAFIQGQAGYIDAMLKEERQDDLHFREILLNLLMYYREQKNLLQVLLGEHGDIHLEYDILSFFAERILATDNQEVSMSRELLEDYTYAASGSFGIIMCWIREDCNGSPERLASRITELTRTVRGKHRF